MSTPIPPARDGAAPVILRLALALLAKAERSSGSGPVRLALDPRVAPEFHGAPDADQLQLLQMQLEDLSRSGCVALRLEPPRPFATFTDRKPRLELLDFQALSDWAGYTPQALRWQRQWREHLAARWSTATAPAPTDPVAVLDYLARNPMLALEDLALEEATRSLQVLGDLCRAGRTMALREASAQAFQGRSKLLDNREELLRLLGAAPGQFTEAPIQLLLALPPDGNPFSAVLFVENLVTFEHMADARQDAWRKDLLVYAAGFRGSARRLRSRATCRLYLRSPVPCLESIESWLFNPDGPTAAGYPVRFFGDLDLSGMQILASLREVFPDAQAWQPGYRWLARCLASGGGHRPAQAAKSLQADPGQTGCLHADRILLPLLRREGRYVDQEATDLAAIRPEDTDKPLTWTSSASPP